MSSGNYVEALTKARQAQNVAPSNTDLMKLIGEIIRAKQKYEEKLKQQVSKRENNLKFILKLHHFFDGTTMISVF